LSRSPGSRFSFIRREAGSLVLFVNGASFDCHGETARLAEELCAGDCIRIDSIRSRSDASMTLVKELVNRGSLEFGEAD
jgi:50S ribosomal protein L16 3-hydroxylase